MKNNYGLVLEGGGAKGAYQIGSYFALRELGFEFKSAVGTSIGAINAAMIVMGEPEKCADLWRNTSMESYIDQEKQIKINQLLENTNDQDKQNIFDLIKRKASEKIADLTIDVEPLKNLVKNNISEEKIRNSKMDFGLVTFNLSDKRGEELYIKDIEEGELCKYIVASCYHPIFKLEALDGKYYLDGGFYNNLPYNMVEKLGQVPVIIRTHPSKLRNIYIPNSAIVIEPRKRYTSAMDFDPIKADEIMRIGYFDSYKKIQGLLGEKYYIRPFDEDKAFLIMKEFLDRIVENHLPHAKNSSVSKYRKFFEELLPKMAKEYGLADNYNYVKLLTIVLEKFAEALKIDYLKIYEVDQLLEEIEKRKDMLDNKNVNIIEKFIAGILRS